MIMQYRPKNNKIINMITGPFINQHDVDVISKKEIPLLIIIYIIIKDLELMEEIYILMGSMN